LTSVDTTRILKIDSDQYEEFAMARVQLALNVSDLDAAVDF
jgi:hypothetical protein